MATKTIKDRLGLPSIELSARTTGPSGRRVLTVYVEADTMSDVEGQGTSEANLLAHKRGFRAMTGEGVTALPVAKSALSGRYQTRIEYTERWRGRSTLDR
jgi:hypothetical protein